MKAWIPLTLVFALGSPLTHRHCTYPARPRRPLMRDGDEGSNGSGETGFTRYNTEMNAYLECIKLEMDAATPKDPKKLTPEEKKKSTNSKRSGAENNAAVANCNHVGRFNEQ